MTPAARVQAAIEVLQAVTGGASAERELTAWGRRARYAGSKDRMAVRDHVYDVLRQLRSAAWFGGLGDVGGLGAVSDCRALVAGYLRAVGADLETLFTGARHAPAPIAVPAEVAPMPAAVAADLPDWALARLREDHGAEAADLADALRHRAPVHIRANLRKTTRDALRQRLAEAGLTARAHPLCETALEIEGAPRGMTNLAAFQAGDFEMQDAGSQALVERLPQEGQRVLDLCAGGGGKALALAARGAREVIAHDAAPQRMRDLPTRAARAGVTIRQSAQPDREAPFDGVIADVPCSGSGAWRRSPEARWRFAPADLEPLMGRQRDILERAIGLTRPGGWIAYMTCSLFRAENEGVVDAVLAERKDVSLASRWACGPLDGADGFHLSVLRRA